MSKKEILRIPKRFSKKTHGSDKKSNEPTAQEILDSITKSPYKSRKRLL